jgi:intron-binding protein aquarius
MRDGNDCYEQINLLVRRDPKENNFKAILETIRDLMNTAALGRAIPTWLHDVFLGYGDPKGAHYKQLRIGDDGTNANAITTPSTAPSSSSSSSSSSSLSTTLSSLATGSAAVFTDYTDTFIDLSHLLASFPLIPDIHIEIATAPATLSNSSSSKTVQIKSDGKVCTLSESDAKLLPSASSRFKLAFVTKRTAVPIAAAASGAALESAAATAAPAAKKSKKASKATSSSSTAITATPSNTNTVETEMLIARPYLVGDGKAGPYPDDEPLRNEIRFTPTQIEAIRSGSR